MGIAYRVAREFADGVRARGQSYFAKGRVVITSAKPGEIVVAKVRGTEPYRVKLRSRNGRLLASCTCPYFGPEGEPCKHLWATILAADARMLLPADPNRPLRLIADVRGLPTSMNGPAPPAFEDLGVVGLPPPPPPPRHPQASPPQRPYLPPQNHRPGYGPQQPSGPYRAGQPSGPYRAGQPQVPGPNQNQNQNQNQARGRGNKRPPQRAPGTPPYNAQNGPPYNLNGPGYRPVVPGPDPNAARGRNQKNKARNLVRPDPAKPQRETKAKPAMLYVVDAPATIAQNQVVITLARRHRRPGTDRASLKPWWAPPLIGPGKAEPEDRDLLAFLNRAQQPPAPAAASAPSPTPAAAVPAVVNVNGVAALGVNGAPAAGPSRFVLRHEMQAVTVERLCRSGRCRLRRTEDEDDPPALRWDDGRPWRFVIEVRQADPAAKRWVWRGALHRDKDRMDLAEPMVLLPGLVIQGVGRAARFDDAGIFAWMLRLRHEKEMALAEAQQDTMLGRILGESTAPASELVEGLELQEVDLPPLPCLTVRTPRQNWGSDALIAELEFDYDGARVASFPAGRVAVQTAQLRAIRRDVIAETKAKERLDTLGFREAKDYRVDPGTMEVPPKKVPQAIRELVAEGWRVEAEGIIYRPASEFKLAVTTGMDWFELGGQVDFGGQRVALPEILAAARKGESMIALGDGSMGMLPEDWLRKYGLLTDLGEAAEGDVLRFGKAQAGLLDALLAAQPGATCDAEFRKVRKELHAFEGVEPVEAPPGFQGSLRPYQEEGLGWLDYLRKFDFGGILADDMGLGKTDPGSCTSPATAVPPSGSRRGRA